jgi:cellulose synthase/poly-beta-1,6-N-acetylglucosamine synthase-like glycosyltransferase
MQNSFLRALHAITLWVRNIVSSSLIFAILVFIVVNFYIFSSIVNLDAFFYAFLLLTLLTDGLFVFLHLPRRRKHSEEDKKTWLDRKKLTIVIASYNGEDVIAETIQNAAVHVPKKQIIVVSDASTDNTAKVARKTGVRVIVNKHNLHKVGSINAALASVTTPYVLIVDDDTLIGQATIPTSLLDEGYTAVAFNVMPVEEHTLINELQRMEYRNSMQIGKHMRATAGAIGNVSGAIGLYRTSDLRKQVTMHSGQFAGEDEQRTLLAHMYGEGKGVTYTDSLVLTKAPATYHDLFRQRAFSWSLSVPELFVLYWRVLLSPRFHFLLKAEKSYLIYIYITDPLRILFLWSLFLRPQHLAMTYAFYLVLNTLIWIRLGCQDTLRAVIVSPLYTLGLTICRFIGYFYWLNEKSIYLSRKLHRKVEGRRLLPEYAMVFLVIAASWTLSVNHFMNDMHFAGSIRDANLSNNDENRSFNYTPTDAGPSVAVVATPDDVAKIHVLVLQGDNARSVAHKATDIVLADMPGVTLNESERWQADMWLARQLPPVAAYMPNKTMDIPQPIAEQAITVGKESSTHEQNY